MFLDKCNVNINAITYYGIISVIKKHYGTDDLEMKPPFFKCELYHIKSVFVTLFESSLKFKDEYHTSKSCQNFDWDDKPAKIKKTILFKEKTEGGLNLTNIKIIKVITKLPLLSL
jgi:hypothetical protein